MLNLRGTLLFGADYSLQGYIMFCCTYIQTVNTIMLTWRVHCVAFNADDLLGYIFLSVPRTSRERPWATVSLTTNYSVLFEHPPFNTTLTTVPHIFIINQ